ncbi:DUF2846 domain-containing protein [Desulfopila sp. IMCC35006]|uniref:DUF2846 domain-containing protein n=1 Tax=Desulfopila sp. IMCC35006 TaxID=2569542 RepID=UPI0010ACA5BE|nr:DUF2846 domain-containing protein [Desulfopila sp. IMCC35006]TKB23185.1 DUF2846 domain-containing protein [Desulfopila sp. IMCC35006]
MRLKYFHLCRMISVLLLVGFLSGCAAKKGDYFSETLKAKEGSSTLYIYRPWAFTEGGASFPIIVNNTRIAPELSNQSYLTYVTKPGPVKIHTDTQHIDTVLEFNAEAGKIYFVGISVKSYFLVFEQVPYLIDENLALEELKKCQKAL